MFKIFHKGGFEHRFYEDYKKWNEKLHLYIYELKFSQYISQNDTSDLHFRGFSAASSCCWSDGLCRISVSDLL